MNIHPPRAQVDRLPREDGRCFFVGRTSTPMICPAEMGQHKDGASRSDGTQDKKKVKTKSYCCTTIENTTNKRAVLCPAINSGSRMIPRDTKEGRDSVHHEPLWD